MLLLLLLLSPVVEDGGKDDGDGDDICANTSLFSTKVYVDRDNKQSR